MSTLGNVVKQQKITQAELAAALGISRPAVSMQIKKGIRCIRTARRYGAILKCNPLFLLD